MEGCFIIVLRFGVLRDKETCIGSNIEFILNWLRFLSNFSNTEGINRAGGSRRSRARTEAGSRDGTGARRASGRREASEGPGDRPVLPFRLPGRRTRGAGGAGTGRRDRTAPRETTRSSPGTETTPSRAACRGSDDGAGGVTRKGSGRRLHRLDGRHRGGACGGSLRSEPGRGAEARRRSEPGGGAEARAGGEARRGTSETDTPRAGRCRHPGRARGRVRGRAVRERRLREARRPSRRAADAGARAWHSSVASRSRSCTRAFGGALHAAGRSSVLGRRARH